MSTIYCSVCGANILRFNLCKHLTQNDLLAQNSIKNRDTFDNTANSRNNSVHQIAKFHTFCHDHIDLSECLAANCQVVRNYIILKSSKNSFCQQHPQLSSCFSTSCTKLRLWFLKQLYQKLADDCISKSPLMF